MRLKTDVEPNWFEAYNVPPFLGPYRVFLDFLEYARVFYIFRIFMNFLYYSRKFWDMGEILII